jgi:hypothetical protein
LRERERLSDHDNVDRENERIRSVQKKRGEIEKEMTDRKREDI